MQILSLKEFDQFIEGEKLLYEFRRHWYVFFLRISRVVLSMLILIVPIVFFLVSPRSLSDTFNISIGQIRLYLWGALVLSILGLVFKVLYAYIDYRYDRLIVTNKRIIDIDQHFVFGNNTKTILIRDIVNLNTSHKGIMASVFQYGTITIESSASTEYDSVFHFLPNVGGIVKIIQNIRSKESQPPARRNQQSF
jgi:uncharacterized membrane protein